MQKKRAASLHRRMAHAQSHLHQYPVPFEMASPAVNVPSAYVLEAAALSKATMVSPASQQLTKNNNQPAHSAPNDMAQATPGARLSTGQDATFESSVTKTA